MFEETEECDDANLQNGDGCSQSCKIEKGFACTGYPSICQRKEETSTSSSDEQNETYTIPDPLPAPDKGDNITNTNATEPTKPEKEEEVKQENSSGE